MDKQTMQDVAELQYQVQTLFQALRTQGAELAELRALLDFKEDKVLASIDTLNTHSCRFTRVVDDKLELVPEPTTPRDV